MNEIQLKVLEAMSIPIWQHRSQKQAQDAAAILCIFSEKDWSNPEHQTLFRKIIQALQWKDAYYTCVVLSSHQLLDTEKQWILFGEMEHAIVNFQCYTKKWLKVPSLEKMQNAQDAKREAWHLLKPYQRKT
ncbi:MAG TPA: DNA polymerase III subunit psi [Gammaproteobacteria bacterium]|nr:DNA polymerase III subunit psi [Gammaproteobacteria bacterium]